MKLIPILCMFGLIICATTTKCEEDDIANPSGVEDCKNRAVDEDKYCCFIKVKMRKKYIINEVRGCYEIEKRKVDNGAITDYLKKEKEYGNDYSLDCISSFTKIGYLLILFILI